MDFTRTCYRPKQHSSLYSILQTPFLEQVVDLDMLLQVYTGFNLKHQFFCSLHCFYSVTNQVGLQIVLAKSIEIPFHMKK